MSKRRRHSRPSSTRTKTAFDLTRFLSRPWVPIVFFALLTAGYFYHILITGDVIYGSDTGAEFHRGNEPFAEALKKLPPKNWSRFMGGTPESSALRSQYYPLIVIDLFTSEHRYFGWRYIFAMFTAGYFMYLCTRSFGLHPLAALIAGAAYASAPAFLSFTHAGHFAKMTVIGLFPLMYWALNRGMDTRRIIYFLILGGTVGIAIYSPHLQMAYFALWALGLLFLYKLIKDLFRTQNKKNALYQTLLSAGAICLGLAIGAEGVIPQYWNTKTSSKRAATEQTSDDGYEFASSWSLHPEEIFALAIPEFVAFDTNTTPHKYWGRNAFKINSEYVGIVPLFFAILALSRIRKKNHIAFLLGLFILAVAYALGPHTPLHKLLFHIVPGVSVLRAPGMIAFLFSFALCALGAYGLHRLIADDTATETAKKLGIPGGICTAILLLFAFVPSALLSLWQNIVWTDISAPRLQIAQNNLPLTGQGALLAAIFVGTLTAVSYLRAQNKLQIHTFALVLLAILLIDTWRIDKMFLNYVNPNRVQPQERVNADAVAFLKRDNSLFRVFALPDHNQMPLPGIDLVTGFNDFAIKRYDHILKSGAINNPAILNLLNTKYIVAPSELNIPYLQKIAGRQGLHIYRNPGALPWFYLTPQYEIIPDENQILQKLTAPNTNPIQTALLEENPGIASDTNASETDSIERLEYNEHQGHLKLSTTAPGPRILVISQNHHPNWTATVNGEPKPLIRANYLWTAVALEPGEHIVELTYRDPIVATTRWITLGGVIILIAAIALCLYKPYEKTDNTN